MVHGPSHLLRELLERSGYLAELRNEDTHEAQGRIENLEELIGAAEEFPTPTTFWRRCRSCPTPTTLPETTR